jgi:hypothetical protein
LSFPAPGGLSGGPVGDLGITDLLVGMVTSSYESYSVTDSVDEVDQHGRQTRVESRKIVSYGIALLLEGVQDWIDAVVPRPHNPHHPQ